MSNDDLIMALTDIAQMTDPDDPENYRADDPEGCLDTVFYVANQAIGLIKNETEEDAPPTA